MLQLGTYWEMNVSQFIAHCIFLAVVERSTVEILNVGIFDVVFIKKTVDDRPVSL
jgi:hypothetical protein